VEACADAWSLSVGPPCAGSNVSLVVPVELADGTPTVLKLPMPDRESEHEAEALATWGGDGAVRLLACDPERRAMLIERCRPGSPLSALEADAALDVLVGLLPRLWKPAGAPFRPAAAEAAHWAHDLAARWEAAGRPCERRLVDAALAALEDLAGTQGEQVLLHQDLHADNVLAAEREPWLVIDPKPLAGERELAAAPIVRSKELGHGRDRVLRRLDRVSDELGLDRDRARRWTFAQTMAWAFEGDQALESHLDVARWLLD
jgi:streptomycin 6-kinase